MAAIITDPKQFYRFDDAKIWADINPQLGVHLQLAQTVAQSLVIYNKAYPPPPPGWSSTLATVIFVGCCVAVLGAAYLSTAGAATAATTPAAVGANVATSVNAAATTVASTTGTSVVAGATTVSATTASSFAATAAKAFGGIGTVAKALGKDDIANKMKSVADTIEGNMSVTEGAAALYADEMKKRNQVVTPQGEQDLSNLTAEQQNQYANWLRSEAEKIKQSANDLPPWVLPAGAFVAIKTLL